MNTSQNPFEVDQKLLQQEELILEATELLATIMEENEISKADLARRLGKTKAHVTQCLSGGQNLTLRTLADLFTALGYRLQLGASPDSQQGSKAIVRLYPIGGWAIEKAVQRVRSRGYCEESAEAAQTLLLCEAA